MLFQVGSPSTYHWPLRLLLLPWGSRTPGRRQSRLLSCSVQAAQAEVNESLSSSAAVHVLLVVNLKIARSLLALTAGDIIDILKTSFTLLKGDADAQTLFLDIAVSLPLVLPRDRD